MLIVFVMVLRIKYIVSVNNEERQRDLKKRKEDLLDDAETIHLNILSYTSNVVGPKFTLAAKSYTNLGSIYKIQKSYKVMFIFVLS